MTILATGIAVGIQSPRGVLDSVSITMVFDNISNADLLVGDAANVTDWNTFFDLPTYGIPFTSVVVTGNSVELIGGSNVVIKESLFQDNINLLSINDTGVVVEILASAFNGCSSAETFNLPMAQSLGERSFEGVDAVTSINISNVVNLGPNVSDNLVFVNTEGATITLTIPSALMTCDEGYPDGDIVYLQSFNTVTIVTV